MSLQVWLPLINNNFINKGASSLIFSSNDSSHTINNANGKIGSCFLNDSFTAGGLISDKKIDLGINQSMCCWINPTQFFNSSALTGIGGQHRYQTNTGMGLTLRYVSSTTGYLSVNTGNGSSRTYNTYYGNTLLNANNWYHVAYTYDGSNIKLYVNGVLDGTYEYVGQSSPADYIGVFMWSLNGTSEKVIHSNYLFKGKINDFRVYDHCLSVKEVKELAKGLVLHYKLDKKYISENLIINGFGELGNENWTNSNISTTEIPPDHPEIIESFYNGNMIKNVIPINPNHTYTISGYIKSSGATSGTTYPSILPYDIDKKFIGYYNCANGFSQEWKTTLAQPLKKGDTIIYATDLSNWTTATNNYWYHVAIFKYKDSIGKIYDDMVYTADSPVFGTYSDKSNIDKTNNTITLKSAFTGEDRPAGTVICQATEGNTYYYPWGGIGLASIQNWTFKTANFTPKNDNRLKICRYILWSTYGNCYIAGNKLVDNNENNNLICDSSGYSNHGQIYKYDTKGNIINSLQSPRNSISTYINSENNTTSTASGTVLIYGNCELTNPEYLSVSFWCKPIGGYSSQTGQGQFCLTMNNIGITTASDYSTAPMHNRDSMIDMSTSTNIHKAMSFTPIKNEWHHYVITYDGRYGKTYKDGTQISTLDMETQVSLASMKAVVLGYSYAGGVYRSNKTLYSDFRLYTTCLSEDDIKKLYNNPISISKNEQLLTYGEFIE